MDCDANIRTLVFVMNHVCSIFAQVQWKQHTAYNMFKINYCPVLNKTLINRKKGSINMCKETTGINQGIIESRCWCSKCFSSIKLRQQCKLLWLVAHLPYIISQKWPIVDHPGNLIKMLYMVRSQCWHSRFITIRNVSCLVSQFTQIREGLRVWYVNSRCNSQVCSWVILRSN